MHAFEWTNEQVSPMQEPLVGLVFDRSYIFPVSLDSRVSQTQLKNQLGLNEYYDVEEEWVGSISVHHFVHELTAITDEVYLITGACGVTRLQILQQDTSSMDDSQNEDEKERGSFSKKRSTLFT
jgi:hypothetical protein